MQLSLDRGSTWGGVEPLTGRRCARMETAAFSWPRPYVRKKGENSKPVHRRPDPHLGGVTSDHGGKYDARRTEEITGGVHQGKT